MGELGLAAAFLGGGRPPVVATGWWEGEALVLEHQGRRSRLQAEGDTMHQQISTAAEPAGAWRPVLTGRYARMSGH